MTNFIICWGSNKFYQSSFNKSTYVTVEEGLECGIDLSGNVRDIACGSSHSVIFLKSGKVWGWGSNKFNQLGHMDEIVSEPHEFKISHVCRKYKYRKSVQIVKKVGACGTMTLILLNCGCLIRYGSSFGSSNELFDFPLQKELRNVKQISCGFCHVILLLQNGEVACFGRNMYGQVGINRNLVDSNQETVTHPIVISESIRSPIVLVRAGSYHSICVDENDTIYMWGYGKACGVENGHLMQPSVMYTSTEKIVSVGAGSGHSVFITVSGNLYGLGDNGYCQIIPRSEVDKDLEKCTFLSTITSFSVYNEFSEEMLFTNVEAGDNYTIGYSDNFLVTWGKCGSLIGAKVNVEQIYPATTVIHEDKLLAIDATIRKVVCGAWHVVVQLRYNSNNTDSSDLDMDKHQDESLSALDYSSDENQWEEISTVEADVFPNSLIQQSVSIMERQKTIVSLSELYDEEDLNLTHKSGSTMVDTNSQSNKEISNNNVSHLKEKKNKEMDDQYDNNCFYNVQSSEANKIEDTSSDLFKKECQDDECKKTSINKQNSPKSMLKLDVNFPVLLKANQTNNDDSETTDKRDPLKGLIIQNYEDNSEIFKKHILKESKDCTRIYDEQSKYKNEINKNKFRQSKKPREQMNIKTYRSDCMIMSVPRQEIRNQESKKPKFVRSTTNLLFSPNRHHQTNFLPLIMPSRSQNLTFINLHLNQQSPYSIQQEKLTNKINQKYKRFLKKSKTFYCSTDQ